MKCKEDNQLKLYRIKIFQLLNILKIFQIVFGIYNLNSYYFYAILKDFISIDIH